MRGSPHTAQAFQSLCSCTETSSYYVLLSLDFRDNLKHLSWTNRLHFHPFWTVDITFHALCMSIGSPHIGFPPLFFPKVKQGFASFKCHKHSRHHSLVEGQTTIGIKRIYITLYLYVWEKGVWGSQCLQCELVFLSIWFLKFSRKSPVVSSAIEPIAVFNPSLPFIGMASISPLPQGKKYLMVNSMNESYIAQCW